MNIAFIGLGNMGKPMVHNLLQGGYKVTVFDINADAKKALAKEGAIPGNSIKETIQEADFVFTMLQTGEQVKEVCLAEEGIFESINPRSLYIDSSSIDIKTSLLLHEEASKRHIAMIDAPVSGGVAGAENALLTFMVGGEKHFFEKAKPILEKCGKKIIYAGKEGHGQAAKICNNLILAISMIGVSEAFSLCEKLGLDPKTFFEISSNASGQCWSMTSYCPYPDIVPNVPSNNDYKAGFTAKMMLKDLRLAEAAAETVNVPLLLGAEAMELYTLFVAQGYGDKDFSGIIQFINGKLAKA